MTNTPQSQANLATMDIALDILKTISSRGGVHDYKAIGENLNSIASTITGIYAVTPQLATPVLQIIKMMAEGGGISDFGSIPGHMNQLATMLTTILYPADGGAPQPAPASESRAAPAPQAHVPQAHAPQHAPAAAPHAPAPQAHAPQAHAPQAHAPQAQPASWTPGAAPAAVAKPQAKPAVAGPKPQQEVWQRPAETRRPRVQTVSTAPNPHLIPPSESGQRPAVEIRQSVHPDYIICLEDGKKMKMLKRHIRTSFGMTPEQYRIKWGLPSDYPMVAPNYAMQKSDHARTIGLGTSRKRETNVERQAATADEQV